MTKQAQWKEETNRTWLLGRNLVSDYAAIAINIVSGIALLPFNLAHLGSSAYGLWMLTVSLTTYFSILDLGYGSSQVKFTAQYRALGDAKALNETVSTLFFLFLGVGAVSYTAAIIMAANLGHFFKVTPDQVGTARWVLLMVSAYVALSFPGSVFGGVVNGFQRYYRNNAISILTSLATAIVNIVVLSLGYGLVELVAATTAVRILSFVAYSQSAYAAFPELSIRWRNVSKSRLQEVTAFSWVLFVIDMAQKVNMASDTMVIGMFMGTAAVAVWAVASRLSWATWILTRVLSRFLFPTIVESATQERLDRLRILYLEGTRLSLASVIPMALVTALLAEQVLMIWVGPRFAESVPIVWLLAAIVVIRIGTGTGTSLLKGANRHKFVAVTSVIIAVTNFALSVALVRPLGLIGVAIGTLVPVGAVSLFALYPAACQRVGLSVWEATRISVWPAVWPAIPTTLVVLATRGYAGHHVVAVAAVAVLGGLTYAVTFVFIALRPEERRWYLDRLSSFRRRGEPVPA
jgi:O-antigen/teichoic acid export membrane protein